MNRLHKQDVHGILDIILKSNKAYLTIYTILEKYPVVQMKDSYFKCLYRLTRVIYYGIKKSSKDHLPCVVREYRNSQILIMFPFIYIFKSKLLFLINHNLAHDPNLKLHLFLDSVGIQLLTIDSKFNLSDEKLFKNRINIDSEIVPKTINCKKKEIVIFSKRYLEIIKTNIFEGYTVLIPNRKSNTNREIGKNLISYGTQSKEVFLNMLQNAEIVILDYDKDDYYYRTSGVLWECRIYDVFIIANNYLIFKNQLKGYNKKMFYDSIDQIGGYQES
ncbi:hypothetical protein [Flavobacterium sp. Arc2]|uniref:hypothetical protein n=1 Tax=Flavobacterium sp. Arc2 TaxID=3046685 RepID=UPI00352E27B2